MLKTLTRPGQDIQAICARAACQLADLGHEDHIGLSIDEAAQEPAVFEEGYEFIRARFAEIVSDMAAELAQVARDSARADTEYTVKDTRTIMAEWFLEATDTQFPESGE